MIWYPLALPSIECA